MTLSSIVMIQLGESVMSLNRLVCWFSAGLCLFGVSVQDIGLLSPGSCVRLAVCYEAFNRSNGSLSAQQYFFCT